MPKWSYVFNFRAYGLSVIDGRDQYQDYIWTLVAKEREIVVEISFGKYYNRNLYPDVYVRHTKKFVHPLKYIPKDYQ